MDTYFRTNIRHSILFKVSSIVVVVVVMDFLLKKMNPHAIHFRYTYFLFSLKNDSELVE